jgi:hypothetical protein
VYQRYYLQALEAVANVTVRNAPWLVRAVPGAARKAQTIRRLSDRGILRGGVLDSGMVGRYVTADGKKFAIDARDNHRVLPEDLDALGWADVYFKANRRPTEEYAAKVVPIVNGNGILDARGIRTLRALRDAPKDLDVVFVSNVWGGREHNVRLFKELARHDGPKVLRAVLPAGAPPEDDAHVIRELEAADVPWTRDTMPPAELWSLLARARVVPFRSGKHLCIPWRMLDLLAMGACVMFDTPPLPQWPVRLEPGVHYADAGVDRDAGAYESLRPTLDALLGDEARRASLTRAAAAYFDEHAAPERVGAYISGALGTP